MNQKTKKQLTYWLSVIVVGIALGLGLQFVRAWTEPTVAPPGGNLEAPINTSATAQTKAGGLNISGKLKVGNDAQPQAAGQIRWSGIDFEGFDGTAWKSFTTTGGVTSGSLMYQCPDLMDTGAGRGRCWNCNTCAGQLQSAPTCEFWRDCGDNSCTPTHGQPSVYGNCEYQGPQSCYAVWVP